MDQVMFCFQSKGVHLAKQWTTILFVSTLIVWKHIKHGHMVAVETAVAF